MVNITEICKKYNKRPRGFCVTKPARGKWASSKTRQGGYTMIDESILLDFAVWLCEEGREAARNGRHIEWLKENGV